MDIFAVEAYTASWIEISYHIAPAFSFPSKPIRLRGLKSILAIVVLLLYVEAYTASWIEMVVGRPQQMHILSKPIRLRGLK